MNSVAPLDVIEKARSIMSGEHLKMLFTFAELSAPPPSGSNTDSNASFVQPLSPRACDRST